MVSQRWLHGDWLWSPSCNSARGLSDRQAAHAVRARLDIVHLSDTGREAWRHDPVGQGSCDFAAFGAALRDIGYAKTSMMEIVADPPIEPILASHRQLAKWGWSPAVV